MCFQHLELWYIHIRVARQKNNEIVMSHETSQACSKYKVYYFYLEFQYGWYGKKGMVSLCKLKLLHISVPNYNRYFFHVGLGGHLNIINRGVSVIIFF